MGADPSAVRRSRFLDLWLENRAARAEPFLGARSISGHPRGNLKRGGFALAFVGAAGLALAIAFKVNGPAKHKGDAQFGSLLDAAKRRLTGAAALFSAR